MEDDLSFNVSMAKFNNMEIQAYYSFQDISTLSALSFPAFPNDFTFHSN